MFFIIFKHVSARFGVMNVFFSFFSLVISIVRYVTKFSANVVSMVNL